MFVIIDKLTMHIKDYGTNSAFPDGNIPHLNCKEGEEIIRLHDDSELAKKILNANYKKAFNDDFSDIINLETEEETLSKEKEKQRQEILSELSKLDTQIPRIVEDLIDFVKFVPHQSKKAVIDRKKELRQQLQNFGGQK